MNTVQTSHYIKWFDNITKSDINSVGGKGANLGEMTKEGFPVPNGFVVTAETYFEFVRQTGIQSKIRALLKDLDVDDSRALQQAGKNVRDLILSVTPSPEIKNAIIAAYQKLSQGQPGLVAIRSSATAEDLPEASFAGQQESYMNIKGKAQVAKTTQMAWASLFEDRAIFYREEKGFDHFQVGIAVPVQKMVTSEVSGVMFTVDPISGDQNNIAIEAAYGYGDAVVSGSITPDQYLVDKEKLEVTNKAIVKQTKMLGKKDTSTAASAPASEEKANVGSATTSLEPFREGSRLFWLPVSKAHAEKQKLSDELILKLAEIGKNIEAHYDFPQDIEWAAEGGKIYIVQTRPITTLNVEDATLMPSKKLKSLKNLNGQTQKAEKPPILSGLGASPGIASGPVKIIPSAEEIDKVKEGDILVTEMTTPDFVPAMRRAVAVVTNLGGRTSHAAIVSRELGIPAIVGTELATKTLKEGEAVTVDGKEGKVYEGNVKGQMLDVKDNEKTQETSETSTPNTQTATKVYCNLGEPQLAGDIAKRHVDGVGLLRAEFMIANIGQHPRYMLEQNKRDHFVEQLYKDILKFAKAFDPRPIIYRTTDFKTNEYASLEGGEKFENEEANPMLGFRGVSRYLADPEVFKMELEAIKKVRRDHQNLWIMLPFVRTVEELKGAKKIMSDVGLHRTSSFKIFMMVEIPSNVVMLEKFIGAGIDGISIGSNDLTQLTLGVDRDNGKLGEIFDERDDAVLWMLERAIKVASEHGIASSICGQAPSEYPELAAQLVKWGISSVSVSPDRIEKTRAIVADAELARVTSK